MGKESDVGEELDVGVGAGTLSSMGGLVDMEWSLREVCDRRERLGGVRSQSYPILLAGHRP